MKKRMTPGIVLSVLAVYLAFETFLMYSRITGPDGAFLTGDGGIGLYLFALCAVTALLALAAVLCFRWARRGKARGD